MPSGDEILETKNYQAPVVAPGLVSPVQIRSAPATAPAVRRASA
jgi:hypothetical protein